MKKIVLNQTWKRFLWNLQQMGEVIRPFCWHQTFAPWGLSAPAPGLYTCIKSWKKLYKIRLQRDFFATCKKWPKWQGVPVDIKISSQEVVSPCPGAIYMYKIMKKNCIKSDFKEIFLKLVENDRVTRGFWWHKNFVPWVCLPLTWGYIHLLNHEKMCIKSAVEEILFKLATNDHSDEAFLLT